jgi:hypothetical protein
MESIIPAIPSCGYIAKKRFRHPADPAVSTVAPEKNRKQVWKPKQVNNIEINVIYSFHNCIL